MSTRGERGPVGDHGQAGDPGRTGATGPRGEKGEKGVPPWAVRKANFAYILNWVGMLLFVSIFMYQDRQNDERDAKVLAQFEAEALANDVDFCNLSRDTRNHVNDVQDAVRGLETAVRQAFELVQPSPNATEAERARITEFRRQIISRLEGVIIGTNLETPDCSNIGNGLPGFVPPTTTTTGRP